MRLAKYLSFVSVVWLSNVIGTLGEKSYYDILGISRTAKPKEIKKAYGAKAKEHHPDVSDAEDAKEKFQEIAEAYEILSDEDTKKIYDKHGKEGIENHRSNQGGGQRHQDPFDILRSFGFGGGRGRGGHQQQPRHETEIPFFVSLEQMYLGTDHELEVEIQRLCMKHKKCVKEDQECVGAGVKMRTVMTRGMGGTQFIQQQQIADEGCSAAGFRITPNCSHCPGGLYEKKKQKIFISVPPGTEQGHKFRFTDVGREDLGQERGDITVIITQLPHSLYTRVNMDLHTTITITLADALGGFQADFPSPDGVEESNYKLVRKVPVAHGETQIIRGRGMPDSKGHRGNLRITYLVNFPVDLSEGDAKALKDILNRTTSWKPSVC